MRTSDIVAFLVVVFVVGFLVFAVWASTTKATEFCSQNGFNEYVWSDRGLTCYNNTTGKNKDFFCTGSSFNFKCVEATQ